MSIPARILGLAPGLLGLCLLAACGGGGGGGGGGSSSGDGGGGGGAAAAAASGTIRAAGTSVADGDVNDPGAPLAPNDTRLTAQDLPNPATVGGYVNLPGQGALGRSLVPGDPQDTYRAVLALGQVIRLQIAADGAVNDLALELLEDDAGEALVAVSNGSGQSEEIVVATPGSFLIRVRAVSGASNYVLTLGQGAGGAGGLRVLGDFVPGEVIVRFREGGFGIQAALPRRGRARALALEVLQESPDGQLRLGCSDPEERSQAFLELGLRDRMTSSRSLAVRDSHARLRSDTVQIAAALRSRPDVEYAELNYLRSAHRVASDEFADLQWHYDQINLPTAWDAIPPTGFAQRPVVAVIDSGVALGHPDLAGQLTADGYDFVSNPASSGDGNGCDPDPDDPGDGFTPGASTYHGTHVAGTVAAATSFAADGVGNDVGVAGAAWPARVMPLRALGRGGSGTDFDIAQAILYAADLPNACGARPGRAADVINLSLGGPARTAVLEDAVAAARASGVLIVASAGNSNSSAPSYPAAYDGVISVVATDPQKRRAPYSNFGASVDVSAPGGDLSTDLDGNGLGDGVLSTLRDGSSRDFVYGFAQGTSMAAPHVSAVLALMQGLRINQPLPLAPLTPAEVDQLLANGSLTEDLGDADQFGAGLIDAFAALEAALGAPPPVAPVLRVEPDSLNFGALAETIVVSVGRTGGAGALVLGPPEATIVEDPMDPDDGQAADPWLTVAPVPPLDAENLGAYRIQVDRSKVVREGPYTGSVSFVANPGAAAEQAVTVPVIMQNGGVGSEAADAGHHFVLLLEPGSLAVVRELQRTAVDGRYVYDFSDIDPGRYVVVAGTDLDNDGFICDAGEACGGYPTLDTLLEVDVDGPMRELDFVTGFSTNLQASSLGGGAEARPGEGFQRPRRF